MIAFLTWTIVGAYAGAYTVDKLRGDAEEMIVASGLGALFAPVAVGVALFLALRDK